MAQIRVSVAGACGLLGQHLLARLAQDTDISVESLHDPIAHSGVTSVLQVHDWHVGSAVKDAFAHMPLLPPDSISRAPLLLSFLPDAGAEDIESQHLNASVQVVSHCEYARAVAPLVVPGVCNPPRGERFFSTPNCTTAMVAHPLACLHRNFGVEHVTLTTMQAISGTDLPGMAASAIHDQVIGFLPGEANALADELSLIFNAAFPVTTFASRVPVWRGHNINMSARLAMTPRVEDLRACLEDEVSISIDQMPSGRTLFEHTDAISTVTSIRMTEGGVALTIFGDNLGAATTGLMHQAAYILGHRDI